MDATSTQRTSFTIDGKVNTVCGYRFNPKHYKAKDKDADSKAYHERGLRRLNRNNISNY